MFNRKMSHLATENPSVRLGVKHRPPPFSVGAHDLIVLAVSLTTAKLQHSTWPGMSFCTNPGSMTYNIRSRTYMISLFSVLVADFMRTSCSMFIVGVAILVALESELTTNVATCYSH